eukprot:TRINITY_DN4802_c0_g1_i1.p1 TRINITY_DN4802_c0_g1~~TRINITY_DN4802_c0_g1_i1.p1  ORF type:complete len:314 (-),score=82.61 TRINITY_DN4802_c0_g1_i1:36-977(-)
MSLELYRENATTAMIACAISGMSTAIGGLIIVSNGNPSFTKLGHMLSFSSGVMLYISFMDLLAESIAAIGFVSANFWFFMGMLFFVLVVSFFPEPKPDKKEKSNSDNGKPNDDGKPSDAHLKHLGLITAVGISLHNFPEGMAVYVSCLKGISMGLPLTLAIAAHNIPEGMAVAAPIYAATKSKWQAFKYSMLSGLCEPAGAIIFGVIFGNYLTEYMIQAMLAGVAGIMVFMVISELMPATLKYIKKGPASISNIIGMFVIFLSIHYLHGMLGHAHGHSHGPAASSSMQGFPQAKPMHGHAHGHDHAHGHGHAH